MFFIFLFTLLLKHSNLPECLGESDSAASHTEATCTFKDVFPSAKVKWFQGTSPVDASVFNVTTTEKEDSLGRFTITSRVKWNPSKREPYNCSLWMDIENPDNTTTAQMVRSIIYGVWTRLHVQRALALRGDDDDVRAVDGLTGSGDCFCRAQLGTANKQKKRTYSLANGCVCVRIHLEQVST